MVAASNSLNEELLEHLGNQDVADFRRNCAACVYQIADPLLEQPLLRILLV